MFAGDFGCNASQQVAAFEYDWLPFCQIFKWAGYGGITILGSAVTVASVVGMAAEGTAADA